MNIQKTTKSKLDTFNKDTFTFGDTFIDHMVICEYDGNEWGEMKLMPYGPLQITPANMAFNYGQACFEGMKAYKDKNGEVFIFRPDKNFVRINKSAERLAIPQITEEMFMNGIKALVDIDRDWIPEGRDYSLYIRPLLFASSEYLKATISKEYIFAIVATPAKAYYSEPVSVLIADHYSRAANGGTGFAKAAGNYGGSFYPTKKANEKGYQQVIWTDDATHKYIEECGTMNVFFRINDTIYTPPVSERILDGVTRDSILKLAEKNGIEVVVDRIEVKDIIEAHKNGSLKEAWGVGTAVVANQFKAIGYGDQRMDLPILKEEESFALKLKNDLIDIQSNQVEDPFGWRVQVSKNFIDTL